jgi:hypothetical protein
MTFPMVAVPQSSAKTEARYAPALAQHRQPNEPLIQDWKASPQPTTGPTICRRFEGSRTRRSGRQIRSSGYRGGLRRTGDAV